MSKLPAGWARTKIGDLCNLVNGRAFKPSDWVSVGLPIIRIQNLNRPEATFNYFDGSVDEKFLVQTGDLLFAWSGTPGTSFGAHIWNGPNAILNQHIFNVRYNNQVVDKAFFRYAINQTLDEQIAKAHGGVGLRHVTKGKFEETDIALPPLQQQRRIVVKIESLSAKSRRACDHLDHIPRLVEKYKQAILATAFRGELASLSVGPTKSPNPKCWDLPAGWRWIPFFEAVDIVSNLVKPATIPDLPHIAPDNVEAGTGRLLPYRTIRDDKVISPKHRFRPGQVIYSKIRPYLRKAVIVDFEGACSADMYPLSPKNDVSALYLLYWLISEQFASFTVEHEGRTVLPKINQVGLNQTPFPLAPLQVQEQLTKLIQTAFAWIDRLALEAASARTLINRFDQAVLAKAFEGALVPQDANDGSASVLLQRIRSERSTRPKTTPAKKQNRA